MSDPPENITALAEIWTVSRRVHTEDGRPVLEFGPLALYCGRCGSGILTTTGPLGLQRCIEMSEAHATECGSPSRTMRAP